MSVQPILEAIKSGTYDADLAELGAVVTQRQQVAAFKNVKVGTVVMLSPTIKPAKLGQHPMEVTRIGRGANGPSYAVKPLPQDEYAAMDLGRWIGGLRGINAAQIVKIFGADEAKALKAGVKTAAYVPSRRRFNPDFMTDPEILAYRNGLEV